MGGKNIEIKPGDKYGRLTIVKEIDPHINTSGRKIRKVLCRCSCGNEKGVNLNSLRRGLSKSCGCFQKEKLIERLTSHGLTNHPLHNVWRDMKSRCNNINNNDYGGRGITVCPQWRDDFKSFYDWAIDNGWDKGLQIDRINNDGNYEPSNCRFVTSGQNTLNKRIPKNNTSGYRGVYYHKQNKKWVSQVKSKSKYHYIGCYSTPEQAAIAYNLFVVLNNLPNKLNII